MSSAITHISEEKSTFSKIRLLFRRYTQHWYLFILSVTLSLGGAYWYLRYTTPIYQVSALLLIKNNPRNVSDEILKKSELNKASKVVEDEIEVIKSNKLMLHVVDNLNLTVGYFKQGKVSVDEEIYGNSPISIYPIILEPIAYQQPVFIKIINKYQYELQDYEGQKKGIFLFNQNIKNEYGNFHVSFNDSINNNVLIKVIFTDRNKVAQNYRSVLKVSFLNPTSTVLKLTLEDALPSRGKAVLSKLLEAYTDVTLKEKNLEAKNTINFIDERLRLITGELNNVEQSVESYKSEKGITDLGEEGHMFLGNVNANDAKINEIDVQLQMLDGVNNYLKNSQTGIAPASLNDPILTELLRKLNELQIQKDKYERAMQPDNPFLKQVYNQISSTKISIRENVTNQRQNLLITRSNLQQLNKKFTSSIRTIPRKEREFITIKRQQSIKESLYLLLLQKKEETAISYASSVTDSQIVDEPSSSLSPLKPNKKNIYLVAFLAGLLVPIGGISLISLLSDRVQSRKEIEQETGISVFGEIMKKPKDLKNTIIDTENNRIIAEQFKVIRANLPYIDKDFFNTSGQIILVTSSTFGEGKSFFSTNMAYNLAQLDKKVIILELDLRNPKTTNYMDMTDGKTIGLSTYLNGKNSVDDIVRKTHIHPNLYLISSGEIPYNPSELLSNGRVNTLLGELREQFDYILLDTPPVAFVADTLILGPQADIVFYIVRQGYTTHNHMQMLSSLEANKKFKSLHVILNGVDYNKSQVMGYGYNYGKVN